jgi:hypothetical protein
MKHLFAILVAGSLGAASFSAQAQQAPDRLRAEAMEDTRLLANRIALDDARSVRVRHLTYDRLVQESQITTMYGDDPAMRQNKLRVVEEEYTAKLKDLLTSVQFDRYQALVAAGTAPAARHTASALKASASSPK